MKGWADRSRAYNAVHYPNLSMAHRCEALRLAVSPPAAMGLIRLPRRIPAVIGQQWF
jgi:hypothetical protein